MKIALSLAASFAIPLSSGCAQDEAGDANFVPIFNGTDLTGWTDQAGEAPSAGWVVEEGGILHRADGGGSIFTAESYSDFIFEFEWKISEKGNSGIKYRFTDYGEMANGPEYQVLDDDGHPDSTKGRAGTRQAASLYDILAADPETKKSNPVGEWNTGKIVAHGSVVEHWLNGQLVVSYDSSTDEFRAMVQDSKFKKHADYASRLEGRIHLQDHSDPVWYRNLRIKELDE